MGLGMVATAGAGFLSLAAMMNSTAAHADDIGLVLGGSGVPIPGMDYVESAAGHYLFPTYGTNIDFYQATPSNPFGEGLFTPEGLYPLTGVKTLPFNYPSGADGFPDSSTSVGQGDTILANTIESDIANGNTDTVFGYSQSSVISGLVMQELTDAGIPKADVNFLLVADETAPNGGLLSRFDGFTPSTGAPAVSDPLNLPSLGIGFDGATPSSDYATNIYTIEYDGFADFPKYPLNFLSDLNAFLGIESLHGTYLNGGDGTDGLGSGPSLADIQTATPLPVSADDLSTNYYMITTLDGTDTLAGHDITAPLVALLPTQLQELLGPDLTYLINLGYGDGSVGYSTTDADVNTPFGLSNGVSATTEWNTLVADTQQGIQNLMTDTDPYAAAATSSGAEAATAVPAAAPTLTDIADAFSSALSTASSVFLPLSDISNALTTSLPAYDWSLFADNIATGDYTDAFGLPIAANTALDTLAAGFAVEVIQSAASQIAADFASIGF
jgi:PE-PPE domain-containing protein